MELYNTYTKTKEITKVIVTKPTKQAIRAAKSQLGKSEEATKPSRSRITRRCPDEADDRLVLGIYIRERNRRTEHSAKLQS